MGYNSVAVILNDALGAIADDPEFGQRIRDAVHGYNVRDVRDDRREATARTPRGGVHCGALRIIGQEHADWFQTIVVGGNNGWSLDRDDDVPDTAIRAVIRALERRGYRVNNPRKR